MHAHIPTLSTANGLEQKMLDADTVEGTALYIIDGLDLKAR